MGTLVRDGRHDEAEKVRHQLAVIRVARDLGAISANLSDAERSDLAAIVFGGTR